MTGLTSLLLLPALVTSASPVPAPGPEWQPAGWGGGGFYWSVAYHPTRAGTIYLGGDVAGVYRTEDAGATWRHVNRGISGYEVLTLTTDPAQPDRLYAVTTHGISVSEDRAATWRTLPASLATAQRLVGQKDRSVHCLAVDPQNPKHLAFVTPDGRLLDSADAGVTWALRHTVQGGHGASVAFLPQGGEAVAAMTSGLVRLAPGGVAHSVWSEGPARAVSFARTGTAGYAAVGQMGLIRTEDRGLSWRPTGLSVQPGEDWLDVVVDPKRPEIIHAIAATGWGGTAATSTDAGKTWTRVSQIAADAVWNPTDVALAKAGPVPLSNPRNLAVNPNDGQQLAIAANWRPVLSVDGGKTWAERSRGADITVITDIQFHGGKTYVTAMDEGLFVSDTSPVGWRQIFPLRWAREDSGHQWRVQVWDNGQQILSMGSPWDFPQTFAYRSLDGGATMVRMSAVLPTGHLTRNTMWERGYPRALASHPSNPYTVYLGIDGDPVPADPAKGTPAQEGGGIFKSTDGGWHWQRLPNQPASRRVFNGLVVDPTNPRRLFWATCGEGGGLYRSEDAGDSWTRVFDRETWMFNVHVAEDGAVYAPGTNLWVSRDHGKTWRVLTNHTDGVHLVGLTSDPARPNRLWYSRATWDTSTIGGVFETTDGGQTWREITGNLPNAKPLVLRYDPTTRVLWAGGPCLSRLPRP